jgi:hypothetical protein
LESSLAHSFSLDLTYTTSRPSLTVEASIFPTKCFIGRTDESLLSTHLERFELLKHVSYY